jgi:hypothetical protein
MLFPGKEHSFIGIYHHDMSKILNERFYLSIGYLSIHREYPKQTINVTSIPHSSQYMIYLYAYIYSNITNHTLSSTHYF